MMKLLLISLLLIPVTGEALTDSIRECVRPDYLPFFQNFTRYEQANSQRLEAMENTCREINWPEMNQARSAGARIVDTVLPDAVGGLMFGRAAASFSTLENTPQGRRYMAELNRIRSISSPLARIKAVYELAARHSGTYDYDTNGMRTWRSGGYVGTYRPENLLASSERNGTIGVCREFAGLLEWSLAQVQRYERSRNAALEDTDFSVDLISGTTPGSDGWRNGGGHMWVRVNIPTRRNGVRDFTRLELDTTWYGEVFTPLFPRRSGVTAATRSRLSRECGAIQRCLISQARTRASTPKSLPSPRRGGRSAPATN